MALPGIRAQSHPDGNRIDIVWQLPPGSDIDGVRVVRRAGRYPEHPDDGFVVPAGAAADRVIDVGMQAEQMYYYALFPWRGDPPVYEIDRANQAAAIATGRHAYADYMFSLLPAIYHRYDVATTALQRFLSLTGGQLDQLQSLAQFSRQLPNVDETPGVLLPLIGQWIGWKTDFKRRLDRQRDEIRNAPSIYQRVGLIPTVEATIKRISDWECRSKEYVHNVFASNRPERLNLWALHSNAAGAWNPTEHLLSTDFVYDGRPAATLDDHGVRWVFYHTARKQRGEIWAKTSPQLELPLSLSGELANGVIAPSLWSALVERGVTLAQTATLNNLDTQVWELLDAAQRWVIEQAPNRLVVYRTSGTQTALSASEPVIVDARLDKYPTAALQDDTLWLFWPAYEADTDRWQIYYRRRQNARWSVTGPDITDLAFNPFAEGGVYDSSIQRRHPFTVTGDDERLWLFWLEHDGTQWQLRYNMRDAGAWGEPVTMPSDGGGEDPRVEADLMVLLTPANPDPRIYVFCSRYAPIASGETRYEIAVREKSDQVLDDGNWGDVHSLPKAANDDHHDREPYAWIDNDIIRVVWSSNRESSGWSIWHSELSDLDADNWSAAERLTEPVYSQRAPLPVPLTDGTWLIYRGNRHIVYDSDVYRATETFDERYAGSRTTDVRHQEQIVLRDHFSDPQRYTYDTGLNGVRTDADRIARDTLGAFLAVDTLTANEVQQGVARLRSVVREFMPATDRVAFVTEEQLQTDYVYGYDLAATSESRYILESYNDEWTMAVESDALGPEEDSSAILES